MNWRIWKKLAIKRRAPRHRIVYTLREKLVFILCGILCAVFASVFAYMLWFMYNPANRLAHSLSVGRRYLESGDYQNAVEQYGKILELDERNEEAYQGLMEAALNTDDEETAISLYSKEREALSSYRDAVVELLEGRVRERLDAGDYDGALLVAVTAKAATGEDGEASRIRSMVMAAMQSDADGMEADAASSIYRRLLDMPGADKKALYEKMADKLQAAGRIEEAVAVLEEGYSKTEDEELKSLRNQLVMGNASVFLPDTFIRELNDHMAAGDFVAASKIVRHELFIQRIGEFAISIDAMGEQTFNFGSIQPADMNTSIYGEYSHNKLLMVIVDWERTTDREAVFNELVYVPDTGEMLSLAQRQSVVEDKKLADDGHYYRLEDEALTEIAAEDYFDNLTKVLSSIKGG